MKIDITHNTSQELILRCLNENDIWKTLEQSFQECDMSVIIKRLQHLFDYTGEQMLAFKEEWDLMYNDWYWENAPSE
jgi:hypothetical protein